MGAPEKGHPARTGAAPAPALLLGAAASCERRAVLPPLALALLALVCLAALGGAAPGLQPLAQHQLAAAAAPALAEGRLLPPVTLLRLVPTTLAEAGACRALALAEAAAAAAAPPQQQAHATALAFVSASSVREELAGSLAGTPALVLAAEGCTDAPEPARAPRDSQDTCRMVAGLCSALAHAPHFEYVAVLRPGEVGEVSAAAFAANASRPLPRAGLLWGRMVQHAGVPSWLFSAAWPRVEWPTLAHPYFAVSRDVAEALCAMRSSGLPLRLFGPRNFFAAVALRTLEGLVFIDSASGEAVEP
jgi:hypothetical protein